MTILIKRPTKVCFHCGTEKPISDFHKNRRKKDGREHSCKACTNARLRAEYSADPQKKIAKTRAYHLAHPEWSKERLRAHHVAHAEERYERQKERLKDPAARAKAREKTRRSELQRRAVKAKTANVYLSAQDMAEHFVLWNEQCWICEVLLVLNSSEMHWDHYQPLSKGGVHRLDNLRPSCSECNLRKNGIWPLPQERLEQIKETVRLLREIRGEDGTEVIANVCN